MAEETKRRLYNQDRSHSIQDRLGDMKNLIQNLADSGYGKEIRVEILKAGIKRYYRLILQEIAGVRSLYRSLIETAPQRKLKKLTVRTWFRPTRGGGKVSMSKDFPTRTCDGPTTPQTTPHRPREG